MKKKYIYVLIILGLISCVSKTKYDKAIITIDSLKVENQKLLVENEELLHGEERLINYINMHYKDGKYINAEEKLIQLKSKHPESKFLTNNQELFTIIHTNAKHQKDSIEKHIKDSIRLANINELGDWKIGDYVDDFGNKTGKHYVCRRINGHFSNSATAWSELKIVFEIERKNSLDDIKYGFGTYKSTLNFDEYNNGIWDMQINGNHGYKTKIIKREKGEITMVCNQHARAPYIFKTLNGEEKKYYLVDLLKEEGIYEFEIETRYTKYYFTINSKYLNNALLKAGIDEL